jgi:hypothetical protein
MARKIVNRRELRAEAEAAEAAGVTEKKKATKKAAKTPRARAKAAEVRMKLFWGVFNQSMKRVALFEYHQRKQADAKAEDLSKSAKSQHFVQRVKEPVQD